MAQRRNRTKSKPAGKRKSRRGKGKPGRLRKSLGVGAALLVAASACFLHLYVSVTGRFDGLRGAEAARQYRELTEGALNDLCWVTLGEKKGYMEDEAFQKTWEFSRRYILMQVTVNNEIAPHEEPTSEEIEAYYEEHRSQFQIPTRVQLAHVQVNTEKEAEAVRAMLLAGEPIEEVAARHSTDERTKSSGGLLAWVTASSGIGRSSSPAPASRSGGRASIQRRTSCAETPRWRPSWYAMAAWRPKRHAR